MDGNDIPLPDWFAPLCAEIEGELERLGAAQPDRRPALEQEAAALRETIQGWSLSLAKPSLDPAVREDIEARYADAKARLRGLEAALAGLDGQAVHRARLLDPAAVLARLRRLADVLASGNVTLGNLEIGRHVERIDAFADGRVVMRTCRLGALEGATELLARGDVTAPAPAGGPTKRVTPRRRGRLRIDESSSTGPVPYHDGPENLDPARFSGLDAGWFWEDTLEVPGPSSWAADHAADVVRMRARGLTVAKLAEHFGKTPPTIRKALRLGAAAHPGQELPRKMPRRRWAEDYALEVLELKQGGMTTDEIAARFGKSDTTIRAALKHANAITVADRPPEVGE
jgi:DNA-binding CsgD family transcriptional regulator